MPAWCLIPARGGSKRFPKKSIALLKDKPLMAYAIEAAAQSGCFDGVIVSTDDPDMASVAKQCGATVHERPAALATDQATVVQVALNVAESLEQRGKRVDVLGIVLPTAVLLRPEDLRGGFEMMKSRNADFVMGVTTYLETPLMALHEVNGYLGPYFDERLLRKKAQELPKLWVDSGSFYLARIEALRREETFYGKRLAGYPIPRDRSIDIDEPVHLQIAEALMDVHHRSEAARR